MDQWRKGGTEIVNKAGKWRRMGKKESWDVDQSREVNNQGTWEGSKGCGPGEEGKGCEPQE